MLKLWNYVVNLKLWDCVLMETKHLSFPVSVTFVMLANLTIVCDAVAFVVVFCLHVVCNAVTFVVVFSLTIFCNTVTFVVLFSLIVVCNALKGDSFEALKLQFNFCTYELMFCGM